MDDVEDPAVEDPAGGYYTVAVEAPVRGRVRRLVASLAGAIGTGLGIYDQSAGDLVIRRRADGAEASRIDGGPPEELALTLQTMREQLENLTAADFEDRWSIEA
ncbi:hypothetical protein [Nocardioides sp. GXZ039]|uniref:hypothetical protein n=1 Tax=Nocardioides sp. GXZ039 TaxID=3136018 RepID=UPI0030F389FF